MKKEEFCEIFGDISDKHIKEAKQIRKRKQPVWLTWGAMAACFCLITAIAVTSSNLFEKSPTPPDILEPLEQSHSNQLDSEEQTEDPRNPWQVNFNSVSGITDAAKKYIPGYFTEELDETEIAAIKPDMSFEFIQYSGQAGFDGTGSLVDVSLMVTTSIPENHISISISQDGIARDYILENEPVISVCEKVEYKIYQWTSTDNSITLTADAMIHDFAYAFTLNTSKPDLEQAKEDFTRVLECFANYADSKPDFSAIVADEIPEWFDNTISHEESLNDSRYGEYMLPSVPDGYSVESVRRYKDQNDDYLSGLWTRGHDEIRWKVSAIRETDEGRLTNVEDTENYDLSHYPIPRASSVPEHLQEIVDNPIFTADELTMDVIWTRAYKISETEDSSDWRMEFSVRYGDLIVEVRTKGVNPEWVYQQLMLLNTR